MERKIAIFCFAFFSILLVGLLWKADQSFLSKEVSACGPLPVPTPTSSCHHPTLSPSPTFLPTPSVVPSPTIVPSPTPTATPEPTTTPIPTPTITPTPTPVPSETPEVLPTPPTTTTTPTPTPVVVYEGGAGGPPPAGGAAVCTDTVPPAPVLLKVEDRGEGQVELFWLGVIPVTHYAISYGLSAGNYIYGVDDTGNVTSFKIGALQSGKNYCFAVRGVNGCAPGLLSNEICQKRGGAVLGATTLKPSVLGATGSFPHDIFALLFSLGCVNLGLGLRKFGRTQSGV